MATNVPSCAGCKTPMESLGPIDFRVGGSAANTFWHAVAHDMGERLLTLDVFRCNTCKRVEMFDLDKSLPDS